MNIFKIKQELHNIFDVLEENGGELTPELAEQLAITQEEFKEKVEAYSNAIKLFEGDINTIKTEQKRLKELADKKQKVIDRLKAIMLDAIEQFGETKKSGVRYIDYGTGEISIRNSKSVYVDDNLLTRLGNSIAITLGYTKQSNQLDVVDKLDISSVMKSIDSDITEDDIKHTKLELSIDIPTAAIFDGTGYNIIKEMAKYTDTFDLIPIISKTELRKELEENGSCTPYLARLNNNKSIQIK